MNNDLMPLMSFLLISDDLQKQSNKIIQEVRDSNDVKKLTDRIVAQMSNTDVVQQNMRILQEQNSKMNDLNSSINYLKQKIDELSNKLSDKLPHNGYSQADNSSVGEESKKSSKK